MSDLEIRRVQAASASLAPPANPDQPPIPIKGRVTHVYLLHKPAGEMVSRDCGGKVGAQHRRMVQSSNVWTSFFSLFPSIVALTST